MATEELQRAGEQTALTGSFHCRRCGFGVTLARGDSMPGCPECGGADFERSSMFGGAEGQETAEHPVIGSEQPTPAWLDGVCEELSTGGPCLVMDADGSPSVHPLADSWTRIGRSIAAGIRLDDPTVSRRHAIVVCSPDNGVHVLDDRSVNGIQVNGSQVEWEQLSDGDELRIGRFRLWFCAGATS